MKTKPQDFVLKIAIERNLFFIHISSRKPIFVERMDQNVDIFVRFMNDSNFQKAVSKWLTAKVYEKLSDS